MAVEQLVAFNRLFCYFPKDLCAKNDNYLAVFFNNRCFVDLSSVASPQVR